MKSLYLFNNGKLRRKNNTLYFTGADSDEYFPIVAVKDVYIFGDVDINRRLIGILNKYGITIHFFNYYQQYIGSYFPMESHATGVYLVKAVQKYSDLETRIAIARVLVTGAMNNILNVLRYYYKRGKDVRDTGLYVKAIIEKTETADTIAEIMAFEGQGRAAYYRSFNQIIGAEGFEFEKRTRRPPKDRMNTLISFGNTLLYIKILNLIHRTKVDPRISFLHEPNLREFSLHLDIAEIFKPLLVDRLIFSCLNKKILKKSDFEEKNGTVRFKEKPRLEFVRLFEERMKKTIDFSGQQITYEMLMEREIHKLERTVTDDKPYLPYCSEW